MAKAIYPAHRWRDLHDFEAISVWKPAASFVAPDGVTIIPEYYDFARSSSVVEAIPGEKVYWSDEYNHSLAAADVAQDGSLSNLKRFARVGEFGSAVDRQGHVYVADGYVYVFDQSGKQIDLIRIPERPTSLVVGGKDGNILYIAARTSLYRYIIN